MLQAMALEIYGRWYKGLTMRISSHVVGAIHDPWKSHRVRTEEFDRLKVIVAGKALRVAVASLNMAQITLLLASKLIFRKRFSGKGV